MSNQTPDEFAQIGSDEEVDAALKPKKSLNLPLATAILAGIVVLAVGLAGGAGLHAAFASDSTTNSAAGRRAAASAGVRRFPRPERQRSGTGSPGEAVRAMAARSAPSVSANGSQLVVKTQNGDVTVKLTGDTTYEITSKGTAADLKAGEQVVVSGQSTDGSITADHSPPGWVLRRLPHPRRHP